MNRVGRVAAAAAATVVFLALASSASAAISLVSVPLSGPGALERLEATGLDVTHDVTADSAAVVVYSAAERARLAAELPAPRSWTQAAAELHAVLHEVANR
jgi:hypothetical protein